MKRNEYENVSTELNIDYYAECDQHVTNCSVWRKLLQSNKSECCICRKLFLMARKKCLSEVHSPPTWPVARKCKTSLANFDVFWLTKHRDYVYVSVSVVAAIYSSTLGPTRFQIQCTVGTSSGESGEKLVVYRSQISCYVYSALNSTSMPAIRLYLQGNFILQLVYSFALRKYKTSLLFCVNYTYL